MATENFSLPQDFGTSTKVAGYQTSDGKVFPKKAEADAHQIQVNLLQHFAANPLNVEAMDENGTVVMEALEAQVVLDYLNQPEHRPALLLLLGIKPKQKRGPRKPKAEGETAENGNGKAPVKKAAKTVPTAPKAPANPPPPPPAA